MLRSVLNVPSDFLAERVSSYEQKVIYEVCEVLEQFEEATNRCQAGKMVTSSFVIPCVRVLWHAVKDMKLTSDNKLVSTLQTSVDKRLANFEDMESFQLAAILDPIFRCITNFLNGGVQRCSSFRHSFLCVF